MEKTVELIMMILAGYLALGFGVALSFVLKGVTRIDPTAKEGASWGFRLAILPASTVLWPLILKRWLSGQTEPPEEKSPHRCGACAACGRGCHQEAEA